MPASWCGQSPSTAPKPKPTDVMDGGAPDLGGATEGGEAIADGGTGSPDGGGCAVGGAARPGGVLALALFTLLVVRRRRRGALPT